MQPIHPHNMLHVASQSQHMAQKAPNDRLAGIFQYVALGSMIIMATAAAVHLFKDLVKDDRPKGHSR